jgi:hypothetical protein
LEPQLGEVRSLEKQGPLVLLASTIPQDTTRTILAKLLRERAKEGPKALETAGMFDRMITDPGLLVLVKLLPRKDYKSSTKNPTGATPRPPRTGNGPSGSGSSTEAAQKKQQTEQEWLDASKKLVYAWCARFNAAATAKEAASTESDEPAASTPNNTAAPKLPEDFALGADAKVTAEYHLVWPEKAPPQCAELKLGWLEIHYVRAEESGKLKTIKGFYKNKAKVKPADVRTTDKGLWIENTKKDTQNDRRRSLDVLISRSDGKTTIAPVGSNAKEEDVETDYIIEVLSVEIKEP